MLSWRVVWEGESVPASRFSNHKISHCILYFVFCIFCIFVTIVELTSNCSFQFSSKALSMGWQTNRREGEKINSLSFKFKFKFWSFWQNGSVINEQTHLFCVRKSSEHIVFWVELLKILCIVVPYKSIQSFLNQWNHSVILRFVSDNFHQKLTRFDQCNVMLLKKMVVIFMDFDIGYVELPRKGEI